MRAVGACLRPFCVDLGDPPPTSTVGSRPIAQFEDPEGNIIGLMRQCTWSLQLQGGDHP